MSKQQVNDTEHILLCNACLIHEIMGEVDLIPLTRKLEKKLADPSSYWFGSRNLIETDTKYVQLVSYIIIEHNNRILCYQRGDDSLEHRLKNKLSIGFGGHVSLKDVRFTDGILDVMKTIKAGAAREVKEELEAYKVVTRKKLVLLHSRNNAVDEVHCGFVQIWKVESPQVVTTEQSIKTIGFKSLLELAAMQGFESWSTLLIQYLKNTSHSIQ